jgi:hypothetical protein
MDLHPYNTVCHDTTRHDMPSIRCQEGSYFKNFVQYVGTSYNLFPLFVHFMHLNLLYFIVTIILMVMS